MSLPSADELEQLPEIEKQWAVKAMEHAETYFKLVSSVDGKTLRLTRLDDEIYEDFMNSFTDIDIETIDEDLMKSDEGKKKWREWIMKYDTKVKDYNFGTLLRKSAKRGYDEDNTIFVTRMQFYAIEIARNKQGLNSYLVSK
ncbi:7447_t:CDS:2 [Entrophospora sp. SA101]|nr:1635_t:CDS:2 [Entrophospora candida]CAJ0651722.1 5769_t:CDS:2 [Entrophospora sp. SA101]CAG8546168.1 9774_t:CDS:2 [Entrophospora candida]CAJ0750336.1 18503_t:CDS:2 [Entrophospora sp. SA101]CAJ0759282.1 7447_t:CDS:2 [Entrophospora sp. SA101]